MRKIKFRGMTVKGYWVTGNLNIVRDRRAGVAPGVYISNSVGVPFAFEVRSETVGQYTGLKDKNGVELYEGDIVKQRFEHPHRHRDYDVSPPPEGYHIGVVRLLPSLGVCMRNPWTQYDEEWEPAPTHAFGYRRVASYRCERIGNVWDNPELLKGGAPDA